MTCACEARRAHCQGEAPAPGVGISAAVERWSPRLLPIAVTDDGRKLSSLYHSAAVGAAGGDDSAIIRLFDCYYFAPLKRNVFSWGTTQTFFPQALLKGSQNHTGEHTSLSVGKIRFSERFVRPVAQARAWARRAQASVRKFYTKNHYINFTLKIIT